MKKILGALAVVVFLFCETSVFAQSYAGAPQKFFVTAYYSPLPNQERYVLGSYEADIRMNGNGTNGADGTPVYVGMLSAPKKYAFGTQLYIPGLGIGTVHDRGGAIVSTKGYDKLDVWMGRGDEGLTRALKWGTRMVDGIILDTKMTNTLEISTAEISRGSTPIVPTKADSFYVYSYFSSSLAFGDSGREVRKMQRFLRQKDFYEPRISGKFDAQTKEAVVNFQLSNGVVAGKSSGGAGLWGPKTRKKAEEMKKLQKKDEKIASVPKISEKAEKFEKKAEKFQKNLKKGDRNSDVKELQAFLEQKGFFFGQKTEYFGKKTENAVKKFQISSGVIAHEKSWGAGFWGPKTRKKANQ